MKLWLVIIEYGDSTEYHIFSSEEVAREFAEINFGYVIEKELE